MRSEAARLHVLAAFVPAARADTLHVALDVLHRKRHEHHRRDAHFFAELRAAPHPQLQARVRRGRRAELQRREH